MHAEILYRGKGNVCGFFSQREVWSCVSRRALKDLKDYDSIYSLVCLCLIFVFPECF